MFCGPVGSQSQKKILYKDINNQIRWLEQDDVENIEINIQENSDEYWELLQQQNDSMRFAELQSRQEHMNLSAYMGRNQ